MAQSAKVLKEQTAAKYARKEEMGMGFITDLIVDDKHERHELRSRNMKHAFHAA
jgi:hypothetical protein